MNAVTPSEVYLAAWIAAEESLPPESLRLIKDHDALHNAWRDAGWPDPIPEALKAASERVEADALASIAFDLRKKTNTEAGKEWRAANPKSEEVAA